MKATGEATAALRKNITIQSHGNGTISLRSTKTSEISSFVKNCNLAETYTLRKELNIWHKDTDFEIRRLNKHQENMYKSLLRLSKTKKEIKSHREEKKKDREERSIWKQSDRRTRRKNIVVSQIGLRIDEISDYDCLSPVSSVNCLKMHDKDDQEHKLRTQRPSPSSSLMLGLASNRGYKKSLALTVENLEKFDELKSKTSCGLSTLSELSKSVTNGRLSPASNQKFAADKRKQSTNNFASTKQACEETAHNSASVTSDKLDKTQPEHLPCSSDHFSRQEPADKLLETKQYDPIQVVNEISLKPAQRKTAASINENDQSSEKKRRVGSILPPIRPAHLQRLKSTKFAKLESNDALREKDESDFRSQSSSELPKIPEMDTNLYAASPVLGSDNSNTKPKQKTMREVEYVKASNPLHWEQEAEVRSTESEIFEDVIQTLQASNIPEDIVDTCGMDSKCTEKRKPLSGKRKKKRKRIKLKKKNKVDPSIELNNTSSIQTRPGKVYDLTVYKKNSKGSLDEDHLRYDTTIDVAKHFNLASHKERLERKKLLENARKTEAQQRHRVNAFLERLAMMEESERRNQLLRKREAEEARLAFEKRLEAIKKGPPTYGVRSNNTPSYVRNYVRPSVQVNGKRPRKRSSWSVPSVFTLQLAAESKTNSSLLNSSFDSSAALSRGPSVPDSSSHLVNINIEKYLLDAAEG
ncbi:uncharacterized protein LOC143465316 isoform X2 [Clavelina lepadiformis]|uniref:uncharacterized protein LOC143465316 isoform X2 n=1 Tax=Clavelina lepadiformis TaxID=159417 RepID=UPI004042DD95